MNHQRPSLELVAALEVPKLFSDDLERPLQDLGLFRLDDEALLDTFAGVTLDIGSGVEGFARGLQEKAAKLGHQITVISMNPQFVDWHRGRNNKIIHTYEDIRKTIDGEPFGPDYLERHRLAVAGLVQALPFRDDSFDTVVSTWCFPTVFQEWGRSPAQFTAGFSEIIRVLKPGGVARLSPVKNEKAQTAKAMAQNQLDLMLKSMTNEDLVDWAWSDYVYRYDPVSDLHSILTLLKKTTGVVRQRATGHELS